MKRRRIPRPVHAFLCLLGLLLILVLFRLEYGTPVYGEEAALRRMERQYLRAPGELVARWDDTNIQEFAVWDGAEVQVYHAMWMNRATFYGAERLPKPKPLVHRYYYGFLWRDSATIGWGCPGTVTSIWKSSVSDWVRSVPLLVKNDDPAAVRGHLTVNARDDSEDVLIHQYVWHAEAERENPWVFLFFVTPQQRGNDALQVLNRIANGRDLSGRITAEAEIVWYGEDGEALSRQRIQLIETEGSEG